MFFLVLVGGFGSIESPNWQEKIIMYIYIFILHFCLFVCTYQVQPLPGKGLHDL